MQSNYEVFFFTNDCSTIRQRNVLIDVQLFSSRIPSDTIRVTIEAQLLSFAHSLHGMSEIYNFYINYYTSIALMICFGSSSLFCDLIFIYICNVDMDYIDDGLVVRYTARI